MLSKFSAGLDKEGVDELTSSYKQGLVFRERVVSVLEDDIRALEKKLYSDELFVSNDWENEAKNIVANIRAYKKVVKYLK